MASSRDQITVVVLLPETVSAELSAELPTSDSAVTVIALRAPDAAVPSGTHVHAMLWIPPADKGRLTKLLEAHPEVEWVHCLSAGVDYLGECAGTFEKSATPCALPLDQRCVSLLLFCPPS